MTRRSFRIASRCVRAALGTALPLLMLLVAAAPTGSAQAGPYERTYRQSKSAVERALKELQPSTGGRLPALEGFALPGDHPLNRYQRAYYQSAVQVTSTASGGSVVRVTTKVTAWYGDSVPSRSGYQLLTSNGRLETDLLDQLTDLLATSPSGTSSSQSFPAVSARPPSTAEKGIENKGTGEPTISAPMPRSPETGRKFPSSAGAGLSAQQLADSKNSLNPSGRTATDQAATGLQAEAASLEEVLKNQAHPKNLVAIKKSGTPVVATPSLNGKTLFLASAHDEFEMLDFNADWVHVRISGLSRGWIWRTSLEMPEGISDIPQAGASAVLVAADLFQVTREETAPFPGDWEPLRGKSVKIISVQKIQENEKGGGARAKLEFAKSLLDKNYAELAAKASELAGVVLIFDSVDGGMIAATLPTVQQWKAGTLSDAALWHQCYFDPPETFNVTGPAGGQ
ncbi:MAG TPA: hypothetical protein VKD23_18350 [Terriglobales bacterium]|nr:hypothetical protein [Terriglobales bacterium]